MVDNQPELTDEQTAALAFAIGVLSVDDTSSAQIAVHNLTSAFPMGHLLRISQIADAAAAGAQGAAALPALSVGFDEDSRTYYVRADFLHSGCRIYRIQLDIALGWLNDPTMPDSVSIGGQEFNKATLLAADRLLRGAEETAEEPEGDQCGHSDCDPGEPCKYRELTDG